jgi:carboxynorspermidine decarboxylase
MIDIGLDLQDLPSPAYLVDKAKLEANGKVLQEVQKASGAKILLALKGYSLFQSFDLLKYYLQGTCASSPYEARLGRETMGGEVHSFAAAFDQAQALEFMEYSNHFVFNSFSLLERFGPLFRAKAPQISLGIRINPEQPEAETALYDPSAPFSRLGITQAEFRPDLLEGIEGFHIHNLCEQGYDALERTWRKVEANFGEYFGPLKWINLGGGHHITAPDYDRQGLITLLQEIAKKYKVQVYLEPGEAVALNAGYFLTTVLDLPKNGKDLAILDCSVPCHLPDVLEMPYRPEMLGAGQPGEKAFTYRFGGLSCLAGDVLGDYSLDEPLQVGDRLLLGDMAHYTMVKNNTFNGIPLPAIVLFDSQTGEIEHLREFSYQDFKGRLS